MKEFIKHILFLAFIYLTPCYFKRNNLLDFIDVTKIIPELLTINVKYVK